MGRITFAVLAVLLLLAPAAPALAAIGDQPAEQWSLQGDIRAEKEIEGQMFSIFSLSSIATAPGAAAVSGPFGLLVVGAGAAGAGLAQIASPENAIWENWPEGRYVFHHAPPDKFPGLGVMAEKALYSTVEFMANMIFSITKMLVRTSNNIMVLAFHTSIVSGMVGWVSEGMTDIFSSGSDLTQILISTGLIILLIYGIFSILRGRAMSALSSLLVAVLAVGGAFFFTANARQIISNTAEVTDSLAGVFLATTGRYTSAGQNVNIGDPVDRGLVAAGQTTWQLIVARPWALAQFGTSDESRLKLTRREYDILNKSVFPKESQAKIQTGMRLDTLMLGSTGEGRDAVAETLARPNKKYLWVIDGQDIDHGGHDGTMVGFAPEGAMQHLKTAFFTLLPAVSHALLAILVGLSIVICQIILAPLLLFLPLPFFAMMIPGAGWAFAARYFRTLLGFFMVKLVYGLYLSLVLVTGTAFSAALIDHNLGAAMVVLAVIFFAAAIYRKKFLGLALESVQKGALRYHDSVSLDRIVSANATLARKLGLTDIFSDWAFSRRRGRGKRPEQPPPPPSGEWSEKSTAGPGGFNRGNKMGSGPTIIDVDPEYEGAWEGQPPRDYPFRELQEGTPGESGRDVNVRSPGPSDSGGIQEIARAVPREPVESGAKAGEDGLAATGKARAGPGMAGAGAGIVKDGSLAGAAAGSVNAAAAVGVTVISATKKLLEGEVQTVSGVPAPKVPGADEGTVKPTGAVSIPAISPGNSRSGLDRDIRATHDGPAGGFPGGNGRDIVNGHLGGRTEHFSKGNDPGRMVPLTQSREAGRRETGRNSQPKYFRAFSKASKYPPPVTGKTRKQPYIPRSRLRK